MKNTYMANGQNKILFLCYRNCHLDCLVDITLKKIKKIKKKKQNKTPFPFKLLFNLHSYCSQISRSLIYTKNRPSDTLYTLALI